MSDGIVWLRSTGDQKLAAAVIHQAIEDVHNPRVSLRTRIDAVEFLIGQRSEIWCRIAGIQPKAVQRTARLSLKSLVSPQRLAG